MHATFVVVERRVFTTVIKSLGDNFRATKTGRVTVEFVARITSRVIVCIESSIEHYHSDVIVDTGRNIQHSKKYPTTRNHQIYLQFYLRFFFLANKTIDLLVRALHTETSQVQTNLLPYLIKQLHCKRTFSHSFLLTLFSLVQKAFNNT